MGGSREREGKDASTILSRLSPEREVVGRMSAGVTIQTN